MAVKNFKTEKIWVVFPLKSSGKTGHFFNDALEETLCFKWIDSTVNSFDETCKIQKFSPRNRKNSCSQENKERLQWLFNNDSILALFVEDVAQEFEKSICS